MVSQLSHLRPTRYACSPEGVSGCKSSSAVNLFVSGILNLCGCPVLCVKFPDDLGCVVDLLCAVWELWLLCSWGWELRSRSAIVGKPDVAGGC